MKKITCFLFLFACMYATTSFGQNAFKIPSQNWSLEIDLSGFEIEKVSYSPDSTVLQVSATNKKNNLSLSIFIEKTQSDGDKIACREYYWSKSQKSPLAKENVKKYETPNLAIVEHDTKSFKGQVVNFHSVNAYAANKGYWIDVHISKTGYSEADKAIFEKLLHSIAIKEEA
ncbi:hypothetical protein [Cytophaga hutchinsonii]|nr:hypothetical protein [Cytophaga hutchinsonii]SFX51258.1 hypothetical protein SAMN04487930_10546 [Cytophaga hutchinsonii ATCC 33406]